MRWQGLFFGLTLAAVLAVHPAKAQVATVVASCGSAAMQLQQGAPLIEDQNGNLCTTVAGTGGTSNVNVTQFGGNAVVTGTGASGVGIPRVTVANDSTVATITNPVPLAGATAATLQSASNPIAVQLTNVAGTTLLAPTATNGDGVTTVGSTSPNAAIQTRSEGQLYNGTSLDRARSIQGVAGTGIGVTAIEATGSSFANITSATTTTVKSGTGILHSISINTPVASATITVYDNTAASGTKIGTITLPSTITGEAPSVLTFNAFFSTGLTIVTSGATDLTVIYR